MSSNRPIKLPNEANLSKLDSDFLYHLGFNTKEINLKKQFGHVKIVCMGGTGERMYTLAKYIQVILGISGELKDLCAKAQRYQFYMVGPILCVSHGIGMPSMSVVLHEILKLLYYAECEDPIILRVGSCGGVGVPVGTVVVTKDAINGCLKNEHELFILGERVVRPANFHSYVYNTLLSCTDPKDNFQVVLGNTLATDDFYEGQARTDGAVCTHTEDQKMDFLRKLYNQGIRNIEMEATMFSSLTHHVGIKAGECCVSFVDRLHGDQVTQSKVPKGVLEQRLITIVGRFIQKVLKTK